MQVLILAALLVAPNGGTGVHIPIEPAQEDVRTKIVSLVRDMEVEVFECACWNEVKPWRISGWRYDLCLACGGDLKRTTRKVKANVRWTREGSLCLMSGAGKGLVVYRLSSFEKIIRAAGGKIQGNGSLKGAFALHVGKGDASRVLVRLKGLKGIDSFTHSGDVIYVNSRSSGRVKIQEIHQAFRDSGAKLKDISWVMSRCSGMLGFDPK